MNGIQTRQKNATHLQRMLLVPPQNLIQWGNPFEMPRYTEVKLRWQGCVKLGHHTMSLVHMLEMGFVHFNFYQVGLYMLGKWICESHNGILSLSYQPYCYHLPWYT